MRTTVCFADTDCLSDAALFDRALCAVSPERRKRTDRLRLPSAKRLSLGAGLLLTRALMDAGLDPLACETAEGEHGKPYLPARPSVFFNLSHSGSFAMCVVSGVPAGCDIERTGEARTEIAKRFFTEEEAADIFGAEASERGKLFYRYWTLKESYIKCTGLGMAAPLNSFMIRRSDTGFSVFGREGILPFSFLLPACPDGYAAACCFAGAGLPEPVVTETVDLSNFIANYPAE